MNGNCIDVGTIQAFLDGETTAEVSLRLSEHIGSCNACANQLAVAEDENSFVFSALEREMNTLVPTQRLWGRINESIETEKAKEPIWRQIFAFISTSLLSPSLTAAAGVFVVFGIVAAVWVLRMGGATESRTTVVATSGSDSRPSAEFVVSGDVPAKTDVDAVNVTEAITPQHVKESKLSNAKLEKLVRDANKRNEVRPITLDYNSPLPSEQGYIKTIADLKEAYDGRRDAVFTGSSRVAFERDLAVVNDSIKRMQKIVRKNPNNQAARQVLYSAYQDKIDLLNTVAQRDELMASIR